MPYERVVYGDATEIESPGERPEAAARARQLAGGYAENLKRSFIRFLNDVALGVCGPL